MQCSGCGYPNRDDARFCGGCGVRLERKRACPACGRESAPAQRFCDACGAALDDEASGHADLRTYTPPHLAERILTTRSMLEGERRNVTVLFADVADSTSFAENIDPEEVHALMDRCFKIILEQVHRYEGTVNQFTGDGAMALFGAPIALEDAPRRAVIAALGIQEALHAVAKDVRARHGRDFHMRIGINSGLVVVGKIGDDLHMDYTAVGDTTNLANRLQQIAHPGAIVISDATQRSVEGWFELRDLGEIAVKGRVMPVRAFEVAAEREVAGRIEASAEQGLTPYVGRERELEQLESAFDAAAAERGRVVFVVGDAGLGKSRLLHQFHQVVAGRPHVRLEGHCASYARATAFYCIADAIRRGFGITDQDDEAAAVAKVEAAERRLGGGLEWTLPLVRGLLSLPVNDERVKAMDAITRRSETFRALQARFLRQAERQPIVLVIEDLHWIDSASEEFLAFLAESVPATKALLLLTHRPGYSHTFGDRSYHLRLALQPLNERETEHMAARLLESDEVPQELRDVIVAKAEGNPFFIEEVTNSLLEDGALRRENGGVALARDLTTISIPDSIQDVIMARLDRLADEPKRALQVAAVIGREFALRLLDRIVAAGEGVSELLEELRTLELIYEKAVHPELAFMFKHALTHDVAYESVLLQKRKALHALVGEAIEELYADRLAEHYESLAHHYALGERWAKALDYHERAGEKSVAAYANHAAADHYRSAVEIAERLPDVPAERRVRLLRALSDVQWWLNEFRAAGETCRRAAETAPDPVVRSMCFSRAGWCFHWGHAYESAQQAFDDAVAVARRHGSEASEMLGHLMRGFAQVTLTGDEGEGAHWFETAARIEPKNEIEEAVKLVGEFFIAESAEWRGDYELALTTYERQLDSGKLQGDPLMIVHAEWFAGKAATCLGRYGHALARMHAGVDRSIRVGDRAMQSRLLNTLGWCYAEFGCDRIAIEYNKRATDIAHELVELDLVAGAPELYGNAAINLANNRIALGELVAADETIARVESELRASSDPWMRWRYALHALDARARYFLARGRADEVLPLTDSEIEGARRHRLAKIEARAFELRGRALLAMDARDEAEAALSKAIEIAERIGYPPAAWRALALLAELARRGGKADAARRHSEDAAARLERLGANLGDERLRAELRSLGDRTLADPLASLR